MRNEGWGKTNEKWEMRNEGWGKTNEKWEIRNERQEIWDKENK